MRSPAAGPSSVISLSGADGAAAKLPAGIYTIDVNDQSDIHNFHLTGPGVDETTAVAGEGSTTFEDDLDAGT